MTVPTRTPVALDRARLDAVVTPIARAHGAEVVDVEWRSEAMGWVLRILVEKKGAAEARLTTQQAAVDLELCAGIARDLSPALDVADVIPHRYHLEVSSPGVERPLKQPKDFVRFVGHDVKVRLKEPVSGQKVIVGVLEEAPLGEVAVREGSHVRTFPFTQVESARLVFELKKHPRPGKPHGKNTKHA